MVLLPTSLSRDLFDVYADYKKSTNEVIRWLSRHSDGCEERSYLSSIRELRYFADCVIRKSISIPDELLSTFRQAIRARKRLTKFYKECTGADQGSTETHTYFNETFEGVFKDLCQFCRRVSCHCAEVDTEQSQELSNRYSALSDRTDLEDVSDRRDSGVFTASCDSTPSLVQARNIVQRCDRQGPAIADDCLEEMTQVYTCLIVSYHVHYELREALDNSYLGNRASGRFCQPIFLRIRNGLRADCGCSDHDERCVSMCSVT